MRRHEHIEGPPHDLLGGVTEDPLRRLIEHGDGHVAGNRDHGFRGNVEDPRQAGLGRFNLVLGPFALGDILQGADSLEPGFATDDMAYFDDMADIAIR